MPKKILIAEDEKPMAKALELKLIHAGFDASRAADGEEAIEMLKREPHDLLLLDLVMPKMNGFAVLEEIRKSGIATPVIILSNLSQAEDEKKAKSLGARDFFIKSNTPIADIVKHIQSILAE